MTESFFYFINVLDLCIVEIVTKMAEYLASIFGTEKDKVNCSFYFKIGACRHGDRCSRIHNKPTFSQTVVIQNLYINPQNMAKTADGSHNDRVVSDEEMQEHYDNFFEEVFVECEDHYGEIEELNVCDNLGDHLVGNVYIKFRYETDAEKVFKLLFSCRSNCFKTLLFHLDIMKLGMKFCLSQ